MQTFREMVDKVLKDDIDLNEDVYTSNFQLNKRIKEYLENDKFIIVLLMGMYGRQVDFEKSGRRSSPLLPNST